ncbi:ricin B lectin domain-containing protein, partial [Mycena haematopus]
GDNETCTNATALNSWVFPQGEGVVGTIQIFGDKCLDATNGANVDGTKLQIWTCASGNTNQLWLPAGQDSTITWAGQNKCVDLTNGNIENGNQVQIWDCDAQNDNQKWNHLALTQPKSSRRTKLVLADCITNDNEQNWNPNAGDSLIKNLDLPNFVRPFVEP